MLNSSIIAGPFLHADYADTRIHIKMLFKPPPSSFKGQADEVIFSYEEEK